jgi:hypothetical protein
MREKIGSSRPEDPALIRDSRFISTLPRSAAWTDGSRISSWTSNFMLIEAASRFS